jgi:hypothetical protein
MGFVALKHLRWGDETIAPGDPVPEGEEGRDYASLLRTHQIGEVKAAEEMSDKELAAALKKATAQRDDLATKVESLTVADDEIPEDVAPGETPGWPVVNDMVLDLPDEVREHLAQVKLGEPSDGEPATEAPAPNGDAKPETESAEAKVKAKKPAAKVKRAKK